MSPFKIDSYFSKHLKMYILKIFSGIPIISCSLAYLLDSCCDGGFFLCCNYCVWNLHETAEGVLYFEGSASLFSNVKVTDFPLLIPHFPDVITINIISLFTCLQLYFVQLLPWFLFLRTCYIINSSLQFYDFCVKYMF